MLAVPRDLLDLDLRALADRMRAGHPVAPEALAGTLYRGISLALPRLAERLLQKFTKAFWRDAPGAPVRGWNVRMRQNGLDASWEPLRVMGRPITYGHFEAVAPGAHPSCRAYPQAAVLDYGRGEPRLSPLWPIRDYLVALDQDDPRVLLGHMHLALGPARVPTPSWFALIRDVPVDEPLPTPRAMRT